jgi:hypothetical protein
MKIKRGRIIILTFFILSCMALFRESIEKTIQQHWGRKTVADRLEQFGAIARERLAPAFERIGVPYPPDKIVLVGIKQEKRLDVWVSGRLLKSYPIFGASGGLGPKLQQGDRQVPEGLYHIEALNPNSRYHLALRVNYPSAFDKEKGRLDGRSNLGSDIMIHGNSASVGCLAMGDEAAEDLFVLAAETGIENISLILTPVDFRTQHLPEEIPNLPDWAPELYASIRKELAKLQDPEDPVIR